ncbi:MAG: Ferredoxin, 2Fe-2S, partial [uncultured Sphingomonadaceae bacterium]
EHGRASDGYARGRGARPSRPDRRRSRAQFRARGRGTALPRLRRAGGPSRVRLCRSLPAHGRAAGARARRLHVPAQRPHRMRMAWGVVRGGGRALRRRAVRRTLADPMAGGGARRDRRHDL